ncbi:MAG: hypothetical protein AAGA56_27660, partial [Myxococcota bacterium]
MAHRFQMMGLGVLVGSLVLFEVLAYRLAAAMIGIDLAFLVACLIPVAAGFGGLSLGRFAADEARSLHRAATYAAGAGSVIILATIALVWASQLGETGSDTSPFAIGIVPTLGLLIVPWLGGAAVSVVYRATAKQSGRTGAVEAMAGAAACLLFPVAEWVGYPRFFLVLAALFSAGAALLARAAATDSFP